MKSSRVAKVIASLLLIVSMIGIGAGSFAASWMLGRLSIQADSYTDTYSCRSQMYDDARYAVSYYHLLQKSQTEELNPNDERTLYELEQTLNIKSGGNLVWQVLDEDGKVLLSNLNEGESISALFGDEYQQTSFVTYDSDTYGTTEEPVEQTTEYVRYALRSGLPYADKYAQANALFQRVKSEFVPIVAWGVALSLLVFLASLAFVVISAGHKKGVEGICLHATDSWWLELYLAALVAVAAMIVGGISTGDPVLFGISVVLGALILTMLIFTLARRIKAKRVWKSTLLYFLYQSLRRLVRYVFHNIRFTVLVIAALLIYIVAQTILLAAMLRGSDLAWLLWFVFNGCIVILCVWVLSQFSKIKGALYHMASGDLGQKIDEREVPLLRSFARNINNTGNAIEIAVEQAMRSERMKTELITNVSHDIKTPLTSIISYVDLLKTTKIEDPKALEYIDVLERKSRRLGQLMADLVEASKVTSGNVTVNMEPINLSELIKQAGGEFESRLLEQNVRLLSRLPEQPVMVMADGRHMWRVLDNLFGNTVKYAMAGTRVYVDLAEIGGDVVLSVKNISRDPINVQPDELMERFVRGDLARNTEGSGLGLSIARSLMELQNGTMDIQIDGDLFKVILTLKKILSSE